MPGQLEHVEVRCWLVANKGLDVKVHRDVLCLGGIVIFMFYAIKLKAMMLGDILGGTGPLGWGMSFIWVKLSFLWFLRWKMIKILDRTGPRGCHIVMLDMTAISIYTDDLDLGRYDWDCASARRDLWVYDVALTLRRVGEHLSIHILLISFEPKIWRNPPQRYPRRISALPWLLCHWKWTRKPPRGAEEVRMTLIFAQ